MPPDYERKSLRTKSIPTLILLAGFTLLAESARATDALEVEPTASDLRELSLVSVGESFFGNAVLCRNGEDQCAILQGGGRDPDKPGREPSGFYVAELDGRGDILRRGWFATDHSRMDARALASFLEESPPDSVVVGVVQGDGAGRLVWKARWALLKAGAWRTALLLRKGGSCVFVVAKKGNGRGGAVDIVRNSGRAVSLGLSRDDFLALLRGERLGIPAAVAPAVGRPGLMAHAGGAVQGMDYTNSLDALEANFAAGHRLFELDFEWTADGKLVCIHDWREIHDRLFPDADRRPTSASFASRRMREGLRPMTLGRLKQWLESHPDARIITDIKSRNLQGLAVLAGSLDKQRIIPQIYDFPEYEEVRRLGYDHVILTLYLLRAEDASVLGFAESHPLFAVTMPAKKAKKSGLPRALEKAGVPVCIHTVNDATEVKMFQEMGISCFYTDFILPTEKADHVP